MLGLVLCRPHLWPATLWQRGWPKDTRGWSKETGWMSSFLWTCMYFPSLWVSCQWCFSSQQRELLLGVASDPVCSFSIPCRPGLKAPPSETPAPACQHALRWSLSLSFTYPFSNPLRCNNANLSLCSPTPRAGHCFPDLLLPLNLFDPFLVSFRPR